MKRDDDVQDNCEPGGEKRADKAGKRRQKDEAEGEEREDEVDDLSDAEAGAFASLRLDELMMLLCLHLHHLRQSHTHTPTYMQVYTSTYKNTYKTV